MRLPSILKDLLPSESVKQLMELVNQPNLVSGLKDAANQLGWKDAWGTTQLQHAMLQTKKWMEMFNERWASEQHDELRLGVNATGKLFASQWSTTPLSSQAISTFAVVAGGYSEPRTIACDLQQLLTELTGAQACLVTHSLEQALSLLPRAIPSSQRWAIPRADTVRLASGCDVAELISSDTSKAIEIGASNACLPADFSRAVQAAAGGFLMVRPSRLSDPAADDVAVNRWAMQAAKEHRLPCVELLLDGSLIDLSTLGIHVSSVKQRLEQGIDALLLPGDGWIGGPACGIIVGREAFVKPLAEISHQHGMSAHPLLAATLHASLIAGKDWEAWKQTPLGLMASNGLENLQHRARRLLIQLEGSSLIDKMRVETKSFPVSSSPLESTRLESSFLRIEPRGMTAKELQSKLAARETPIWALADEDSLCLVLRTVEPADDQEIARAFELNEPKD